MCINLLILGEVVGWDLLFIGIVDLGLLFGSQLVGKIDTAS